MSYILDALRKAERERELASVPPARLTRPPATSSTRRAWPWIVAGVILANAGVVAWLVASRPGSPVGATQGPLTSAPPTPAAASGGRPPGPAIGAAPGAPTPTAPAPSATASMSRPDALLSAAVSKSARDRSDESAPAPAAISSTSLPGTPSSGAAGKTAAGRPTESTPVPPASASATRPSSPVPVPAGKVAKTVPAEPTPPAVGPGGRPADASAGGSASGTGKLSSAPDGKATRAGQAEPPGRTASLPPGSMPRRPDASGLPAVGTGDRPAVRAPTVQVPRVASAPAAVSGAVPAPAERAPSPRPQSAAGSGQEAIAKLRLQLLVYSDAPADRLVFINNRKYLEGQSVDGGATIERITPDGAVLSYQGERFVLRAEAAGPR